jgi:hypothetical protein
MRLLDKIKGQISEFTNTQKIRAQNETLKTELGKIREFMDTLAFVDSDNTTAATYRGTLYNNVENAVEALSKKFEGTADWGCQLVQNIIDLRSTFALGNGIKVVQRDKEAKKEFEFSQQFMELNDIDREKVILFAIEAELEGKVLFKLTPNEDKKNVYVRHLSYSQLKYKVISSESDYDKYESVSYTVSGNSTPESIAEPEFVYKKFGGRLAKVNEVMPKLAGVLRNIENLDKALWDLRKMNKLYASPTPHIKTAEGEDPTAVRKSLTDKKWNIGKLLITRGDFELVGAPAGMADSVFKEIETNAKIISGNTGIPVHMLGLPDLLSNRSTAENLMESLWQATSKERLIWKGCYEETIRKAMELSNKTFHTTFNPQSIGVEIVNLTPEQFKQIADIWLPAFLGGAIPKEYFVKKLPDVDDAEAFLKQLDGQTDLGGGTREANNNSANT